VAVENPVHFCQWTVAASPGHPALGRALEIIEQRARAGSDTAYEHFVHRHTGPGVWTDAIREWLGLEGMSPTEIYQNYSNHAAERGIQILPAWSFERELVRHDFGSATYRGDGYASWVDERKRLKLQRPKQNLILAPA
jgi:mannosyltransferase OCH1-like enzyme